MTQNQIYSYIQKLTQNGIFLACMAMILFSLPTPLCKVLLESIDPVLMPVVINFSIGTGVGFIWLLTRQKSVLPPLEKQDMPWVIISIATGGIFASLFLMMGLKLIPASMTSLLSSTEGMMTALLAWVLFKEPFNKLIAVGMVLILFGAMTLFSEGLTGETVTLGGMLVLSAFFLWAIDTNVMHKLTHKNPYHFITVKCLIAGLMNLIIVFYFQISVPPVTILLMVSLVSFLGYGIGFICFFKAIGFLGAARTGSFLSASPFIGAASSIVFLHEPLRPYFIYAALFIVCGTVCLIRAKSEPSLHKS